MKKPSLLFWIGVLFLSACGKQVEAVPPTTLPAIATTAPTATNVPPTDTPIPPTETSYPTPLQSLPPDPTADLSLFGTIYQSEIQAFALESVVNAIFSRTLDRFVAAGMVQEYQVTSVTVFPGSGGLLAEVIYNVRIADTSGPAWFDDGGTQSADGWINGNCSRFDFFTTETEYQLKNKRLCG